MLLIVMKMRQTHAELFAYVGLNLCPEFVVLSFMAHIFVLRMHVLLIKFI